MTVVNKAQARDEVMALLRTAWLANSTSCGLPLLFWDKDQKPPSAGGWARATMQHISGRAATLGNAEGVRRYRHTGTVTVQLFTPTGDGLVLADTLAQIVMEAFAGKSTSPGDVVLRDVRTREVGQTGIWFQTNALASFEYDEVR